MRRAFAVTTTSSAVVKAVAPKPVNVLVGERFPTVEQLAKIGVRRISVGGALARAAWTGFLTAATEIAEAGHVHDARRGGAVRRDQPTISMTGKLLFLCGKMAAGKSTLARELAARENAMLFVQDEWLDALYPNGVINVATYLEYSGRINKLLAPVVVDLLSRGVSVVLDFPGNTRNQRAGFARLLSVPAPRTSCTCSTRRMRSARRNSRPAARICRPERRGRAKRTSI